MTYIGEILFFFVNLAIADYHASRFAIDKSINHTFWAAIVGALIVGATWISGWNWWFGLALLMQRTWCFNPILNLIRQKPFFYTNSGKGGSLMDRFAGKYYEYVFGFSLIVFIVLQFTL